MDRYSFIAMDFHHLLLAGLPAHSCSDPTMAYRGPDDEGTWIDGSAALGHRRLAVIDLEGGRQ
ncbi:hypothetical protein EN795_33140 [bacterium M00.F.Ca.ET.152.01.1.1]|nr:hypothetical protein EN795_33140 [bacterium M00.F.Ca.ET.152.01.1.1]